jgi:hypothetical protein
LDGLPASGFVYRGVPGSSQRITQMLATHVIRVIVAQVGDNDPVVHAGSFQNDAADARACRQPRGELGTARADLNSSLQG